MMKQCPQCGSSEIIPDMFLAGEVYPALRSAVVVLANPKNHGDSVSVGFRVDVCGACGHAELYTVGNKELLEAHKKGWISIINK